MTSNPQMPGCAGTNLINLIYTKLSTFPSSKISQIIYPFSTPLCHSALIRLCSGQALIPNPFLILTYQFTCYPVPLITCTLILWYPDHLISYPNHSDQPPTPPYIATPHS